MHLGDINSCSLEKFHDDCWMTGNSFLEIVAQPRPSNACKRVCCRACGEYQDVRGLHKPCVHCSQMSAAYKARGNSPHT